MENKLNRQNTTVCELGITGSTGVLGRILCQACKELNISFDCFKGDITNPNDVEDWINNNRFKRVIHLAALVPVDKVKKKPMLAYAVNVGGTINLLNALINNDTIEWLFYSSSSHVYKSSLNKLNEESPTNPISLYGKTKLMGENICTQLLEDDLCDFDICCGRIFSFYHHLQKPPFLYPNMLNRLATEDLNKPFFLYGADSLRDFLSGEEVVNYILQLMLKNASGIINIASGVGIRIRDFVQNISETKLNFVVNTDHPDILIADITKLKRIIGDV